MKSIFAVLLLLASLPALHADNLLSNGDFTDGTDHWQGDGAQRAAGGLIVTLQPTAWTKVYQDVVLPGNQATINISYMLGPDTTFSSTLTGPQKGPDFAKLLGFSPGPGVVSVSPNSWLIFLIDQAQLLTSFVNVTPQFGTSRVQTIGGTIPNLKGPPGKTLYLAFPPGQGSVILQNVSVVAP